RVSWRPSASSSAAPRAARRRSICACSAAETLATRTALTDDGAVMHRRFLPAIVALVLASAGCAEMLRGYAVTQSDAVIHPPPESRAWSEAEWGGYYLLYGDFG